MCKREMPQILILLFLLSFLCEVQGKAELPHREDFVVNREAYQSSFEGFWLGQCIANWTGLTPEMDKVEPPFYTDESWGGPDELSIWGGKGPSDTLEYYLVLRGTPWGADDDTDIEYLYLHILHELEVTRLSGDQIREGWLRHMWSDNFNKDGNNFLWVSNENAYELMRKGSVPPETSDPELNPEYDMIDAQLTTEIFGLLAPGRPDVALAMAKLPIMTSARAHAKQAAEFYVVMHSLAMVAEGHDIFEKLVWMSVQARKGIPDGSYLADMYDYIWSDYSENPDKEDWESTRDKVYQRYQVEGASGYDYEHPYDAGINFAAGLVSLFYGQGDLKRTIRIGSLVGWDCDNPTATWGGLIGFMMGRKAVEAVFSEIELSDTYQISRTRRNFPDHTPSQDGEDTFSLMAERCCKVVANVVVSEMGGVIDPEKSEWHIPLGN